ncbi:putative TetR family transcriptional regulator [Actinacidiphila reveromycinica]|uniref:Putative TetR family transcriptional regulator n=1 Tax=Actinacidiphila reveromycinica TaxID=659352 RepID=A0A7U3WGV5_9ACTN|nr:TetR/AcrR family transcriptional regulator [Streptomyces sp. SN-593]BBA95340.1 putative TetR family transcriptional regulator [Streptomyces sp. SN-593]
MTDIPVPPWPGTRKAAPRRALSQDALVAAALRVIETEGMEALSMRRVAQDLGTGPASLYAHVSGREELVRLVLDQVIGELDLPEPDPAQWQRQLKDVMREGRRILARHGDLARLFAEIGVPLGPNYVRATECLLAILRGAGLSDRDCAYGADMLALYISGYTAEQATRAGAAAAAGRSGEDLTHAAARAYYASLPVERFPTVHDMIDELVRDVADERFEFGLDLLVAGLAARIPAAR